MSNIFEIDGEIEDNDDEKQEGQEPSSPEPESLNDDDLGATIIDGDDDEASTSNDADTSDSSTDAEVPWYDRVLSDDDTDTSASTEDESTPVEEPTSAETPTKEESTSTAEPTTAEASTDSADDDDEEIEPVPEIEGLDDDTTANTGEEESDEDDGGLESIDPNDLSDLDIDSLAELENELDEEPKPLARPKPRKKPKKKPEPKEGLVVATTDKVEEEFEDVFPKKEGGSGSSTSIWTWIFLVLFVTCLSLLCYFQFWDGHKFGVSFTHRPAASESHALPSDIQQMTDEVQAQKEELEAENRRLAHMMRKKKKSSGAGGEESAGSTEAEGSSEPTGETEVTTATLSPTSGTVYQVQVAALKQYKANLSSSSYHMYVDSEGGFTKFLMGTFSSEAEVKAFRQKMVKAGFDDAYIVKKVDGKRVEYQP